MAKLIILQACLLLVALCNESAIYLYQWQLLKTEMIKINPNNYLVLLLQRLQRKKAVKRHRNVTAPDNLNKK